MATNKLQWKRIAKGENLPCQSFLRKKNGEILKLSTVAGVTVGQDAYYLPVDDVIEEIKNYPIEESEDEKMIKYFKDLAPFDKAEELYEKYGFSHKDAIAWLEKKCEQKSVKVPKFKVGDFIQFNGMGHTRYTVKEVCGLSHYINTCNKRMDMSYTDANFELVEQKPADTVEPEFHEGDMIIHKELGGDYIHNPHKIIQVDILDKKYRLEGGLVAHFSEQDDYELAESEDEKIKQELIEYHKAQAFLDGNPNNKHVKFVAWLENRGEQKPAEWSEEDEQLYNDLSDTYFYNDEDYPEETYKLMLKRVLDWMTKRAKSLRPQSQWKPDSSMLICLEYAIKHINKDGDKRILSKLLEQLKKLREE